MLLYIAGYIYLQKHCNYFPYLYLYIYLHACIYLYSFAKSIFLLAIVLNTFVSIKNTKKNIKNIVCTSH